ncbi:hypothetical protein [Sphingomicrobium lutaoense]|uniref:Putative membrane protein n=1 Tax=Sphingomicrobium lutaoense TaxID=515949 RepID=A0A839YXP6_9SPHN|nr:hypothetical protein [Sphingomicrobium lutaoense]MBB3763078.1 putative membrane protein [Sphingomicrobium lutaoense]
MLKFVTIVFATIYVVCVGVWTVASLRLFGFADRSVVSGILEPLGWPWRNWFKEQLGDFSAPLVTFAVLLLMTYLAKRNLRGTAR